MLTHNEEPKPLVSSLQLMFHDRWIDMVPAHVEETNFAAVMPSSLTSRKILSQLRKHQDQQGRDSLDSLGTEECTSPAASLPSSCVGLGTTSPISRQTVSNPCEAA